MPVSELPLVIQTSYAELIDQLRNDAVGSFAAGATFRKRAISGRPYWYVQEPTGPQGRPRERYLGPDSPELAKAIAAAKTAKANADARRAIVRSLKAAGVPEPDGLTAALAEALAVAGAFRMRAVVVGTVAFQTYSGLLGVRLPGAGIRTADLDLAQDYGVSLAIDDALDLPLLEILQSVDARFSAVPHLSSPNAATAYALPGGFRVDVLTTNRGAPRDAPVALPSLRSDAAPLRFLDYLLKDAIEAALLSRTGALVNVPAPERYAVHKLIVSVDRARTGANAAKANKDILQAGSLIEALALKRRRVEIREAFEEAAARGAAWRERLAAGVERLKPEQQEVLKGPP